MDSWKPAEAGESGFWELLKLRGAFAVVTTKDYSTRLGANAGLHQVLETETEALPTGAVMDLWLVSPRLGQKHEPAGPVLS